MHESSPDSANRGNLDRLIAKVKDDRSLDLTQFRPRYVERRVGVRMSALGLQTYKQYSAFLDEHPDEYVSLLDALTINVTQFFRDPTVYALFRDQVVPTLLAAKKARRQRIVRLWSAGCATGEEPYSLAMSMLDGIQRTRSSDALPMVIGTDIDPKALAVAKAGQYPASLIPQIPIADRHRYLESTGDTFRMKPEVMRIVRFQYLNLFEDAPIQGIDVVFCRNVFIYFNHADQTRMLEAFWEALNKGGYLVLGRSERLAPALAKRFELVSARERVYRKPPRLLL